RYLDYPIVNQRKRPVSLASSQITVSQKQLLRMQLRMLCENVFEHHRRLLDLPPIVINHSGVGSQHRMIRLERQSLLKLRLGFIVVLLINVDSRAIRRRINNVRRRNLQEPLPRLESASVLTRYAIHISRNRVDRRLVGRASNQTADLLTRFFRSSLDQFDVDHPHARLDQVAIKIDRAIKALSRFCVVLEPSHPLQHVVDLAHAEPAVSQSEIRIELDRFAE